MLQPQRQVISAATATADGGDDEGVVQGGSGWTSRVPGFELDQGGKTGTSQIPVKGKYTQKVWASFVGFLPASKPRFTMIVVIRKPNVPGADQDWTLNDGYFTAGPDLAEDRPGHGRRLAHHPGAQVAPLTAQGAVPTLARAPLQTKQMRLTLLEILGATGGGQVGGTFVGNAFSTFHTDSREVVHGGVFFALRGAEMDGHEFVPDAIDARRRHADRREADGVRARRRPGPCNRHLGRAVCAGGVRAREGAPPGGRHHRQQWQDVDQGDGRGGPGADATASFAPRATSTPRRAFPSPC